MIINKDYAGAVERIDQALLVDEGNIKYRLSRADALAALGRHEDALLDLDLATQRDPGNAEVIYARAKSLAALNRNDEALAAYRQYLVLQPDGPQAEVAKAIIRLQGRSPAEPPSVPEANATIPGGAS